MSTPTFSLHAHYVNFRNDIENLLEVTDFSIVTWLAFGGALQVLLQAYLPVTLAFWMPIGYLVLRACWAGIDCIRLPVVFRNVISGRRSARLPDVVGGGGGGGGGGGETGRKRTDDGVVCFLLGARINHPLGKLAPGVSEIDTVFKAMWVEAEKNRAKWSYLGRTATLFDISDTQGIMTFWISYWRDLEGLQDFATSAAHRLGQNSYYQKKYPSMGIFHETYHSPKGSWETIYDNCPPVGLGKAKYVISQNEDGISLGDTLKADPRSSTMYGRMSREK